LRILPYVNANVEIHPPLVENPSGVTKVEVAPYVENPFVNAKVVVPPPVVNHSIDHRVYFTTKIKLYHEVSRWGEFEKLSKHKITGLVKCECLF